MSTNEGFDLVVMGATPGGIASAIRCARQGLRVLLIEPSQHVGGMWTSGLQGFDTRYAGHRCPVLSEFLARIQDHYRKQFGEDSPEFAGSCYGDPTQHGQRPKFEPGVAERILRQMLADEPRIQLLHGYQLLQVDVEDGMIRKVQLQAVSNPQNTMLVNGQVFVDATYEADLAAMAGAPYTVGRESRDAFDEPHAGRYWTTLEPIGEMGQPTSKRLNLHFFNRTSRKTFLQNTGEGDKAIQGYALRLTLTNDPQNRVPINKPAGYDRTHFLGILDRSEDAHSKGYRLSSQYLHSNINNMNIHPSLPNHKADWLGMNFVGMNHDYPDADPTQRAEIYRQHAAHSVGALYFLQNDPEVPQQVRERLSEWGLPRDEYQDTDHLPWMMYVREARRLRGCHIFTEHDAIRHALHQRTPIHADSVAFAEWPMDSHDCNPVRVPRSLNDGEFILAQETLPSQIPYRCMITDAAENLLVPVCMSSTHVGWGTLRLEPVFMHTGEAAGVAAAMCLRDKVTPRQLDTDRLQQELLHHQIVVAYLADVTLGDGSEAQAAMQYLASRGFFCDYVIHPDEPMPLAMAMAWQQIMLGTSAALTDLNQRAALVEHALNTGSLPNAFASLPTDNPVLQQTGWDYQHPGSVREAAMRLAKAIQKP